MNSGQVLRAQETRGVSGVSEKPRGLGLIHHIPTSYPFVIPLSWFSSDLSSHPFVRCFVTPFCHPLRHTFITHPASYSFVPPLACLRSPFQVLVVRVGRACPFDVVVCGTLFPPLQAICLQGKNTVQKKRQRFPRLPLALPYPLTLP